MPSRFPSSLPFGHDPLTGVLDRSGLRDWLERQLPRSLAEGRAVASLYLELDEPRGALTTDVDDVVGRWVRALFVGLSERDRVARVGGYQLVVVLDRVAEPDLEQILCAMRRDARRGSPQPDGSFEFSAGLLRLGQVMSLETLLREGCTRMLRARARWRSILGKPEATPITLH